LPLHLVILVAYSLALMGIGLWIGRRVTAASTFFVASRQLGPGLIFSTMLAANIGAGSTVGATQLGYDFGVSAWWWVGSAGLGSCILAFLVGPKLRRIAADEDLRTVGDYLEFRYDATVRGVISAILWLASIAVLAGQLLAIGTILNVVAGVPRAVGSVLGGVVVVVYFMAGGLLTTAWVNVVQLTVKLGGFALAVPLALSAAGGWSSVRAVRAEDAAYWTFWQASSPGLFTLALLVPPFIVSPGLLQRIFGARDDRAVRVGVGLNALGLLLYAGVPALLGIIARGRFPGLTNDMALPMILMGGLPPLVGAVGLAAVFSAEISAADAGLFMLTTSLSQDLYKRFIRPDVPDRDLLRAARIATLVSGALGIGVAVASKSIIDVLTQFYALLGVSLFVPIVAGLYVRRTSSRSALAAMTAGVGTVLLVQWAAGGALWGMTPALAGSIAAVAAWLLFLALT
jgi:SSS family solute:Na+ symporter